MNIVPAIVPRFEFLIDRNISGGYQLLTSRQAKTSASLGVSITRPLRQALPEEFLVVNFA